MERNSEGFHFEHQPVQNVTFIVASITHFRKQYLPRQENYDKNRSTKTMKWLRDAVLRDKDSVTL
jgi:hypothetical protein